MCELSTEKHRVRERERERERERDNFPDFLAKNARKLDDSEKNPFEFLRI